VRLALRMLGLRTDDMIAESSPARSFMFTTLQLAGPTPAISITSDMRIHGMVVMVSWRRVRDGENVLSSKLFMAICDTNH
jgi:hypothetical protein